MNSVFNDSTYFKDPTLLYPFFEKLHVYDIQNYNSNLLDFTNEIKNRSEKPGTAEEIMLVFDFYKDLSDMPL